MGFVEYNRNRVDKQNDALLQVGTEARIQQSCIVLVTGFSEGDDLRDQANVAKIKQIATEQGKVVNRVFLQCAAQRYQIHRGEKRKAAFSPLCEFLCSVDRSFRVSNAF